MKRGFFNFLLIILFIGLSASACKKDTVDPVPNPPAITPEYEQYGTPFTGVPDLPDVTIYQVNIRCFSKSGDFAGITARLDSIKSLGINVIYLMPIYPVGQLNSVNSPYCVQDYKKVNSEFGTLTDLRNLIDGAHSRGLAVILDWVANHTAWDNVWMENESWYKQDDSGNIVSPNGWNDVAQLDFKNHDMIAAMIKAMKYWVYAANCDGFRCDYADGPPFIFWQEAIDSLREISTHKLIMMAEGTRSDHYRAGFNCTFGFRFYDQLKKIYNENASAAAFDNVNAQEFNSVSDTNSIVRYITNHDVNSSDGTPLSLFGGKNGSMTAFIITAYMKGIPMIYNGQEIDYPNRLSFPFTSSAIDWNINSDIFAGYKKVIAFRNESAAVKRGTLKTFNSKDICAFTKTFENETVFVVANVRNTTVNYALPTVLANSVWQDAFSETTINLEEQVTLLPNSYLVLKKDN
jgi:glycosidase